MTQNQTKIKSAPIPSIEEKPRFVNQMFARIAPTYDLMNRLMTGGQDQRWREELLTYADLPPCGRLLDVGTGTGDIAELATRSTAKIQAFGSDFTYEMMASGLEAGKQLPFTQADTLDLPYADNSFDAVVSGFMIRNIVDRIRAFREQTRVTKPGGRVICLEITPPDNSLLGPFFRSYFFHIVPLLGRLISGDGEAYSYLPHSTVDFPAPETLRRYMEQAGLESVFYTERMMGAVAIHVGMKVAR